MEKITWLLPKLRAKAASAPHLQRLAFTPGEVFHWNYTACAITYDAASTQAEAQLLHEFGHALLNHRGYSHDVELLGMERVAWEEAKRLALEFGVEIDTETIEEHLDTYRDWLHKRSLCPNCSATGVQITQNTYRCLACLHTWRVNDAKTCQLRRYHLTKP